MDRGIDLTRLVVQHSIIGSTGYDTLDYRRPPSFLVLIGSPRLSHTHRGTFVDSRMMEFG